MYSFHRKKQELFVSFIPNRDVWLSRQQIAVKNVRALVFDRPLRGLKNIYPVQMAGVHTSMKTALCEKIFIAAKYKIASAVQVIWF